jgi:hypothetical protein
MEGCSMKIALIAAWSLGAITIASAEAARNPDPMPGASKDECVFVRNITSWQVLDSRHIAFFTPGKRAYLMQLGMPVSDLKYAFKVAFIDRDNDGQLCGRSLDKVQAVGSLVKQPATIMGITRLDDAGLHALEEQYGVKLSRKKGGEAAEQPQDGKR